MSSGRYRSQTEFSREQLQAKYDRILEPLGKGTKVDPKLLDVKSSELV